MSRKPSKTSFEMSIARELNSMRIQDGEDYRQFARRLYEKSLSMRCANAGRKLGMPWDQLDSRMKSGWYTSARQRAKMPKYREDHA